MTSTASPEIATPAAVPVGPQTAAADPQPVAPWIVELDRRRRERQGTEPAFVAALRQSAMTRFAALGFPTQKQEAWRATNVKPIAQGSFAEAAPLTPEATGAAESALAPYLFAAAATLVFVDGRFAPHLSHTGSGGDLGEGVVVSSLAEALAHHPEKVEAHLGRHASYEQASFVALNTALFADGAFVWLPRGAVLPGPLHLVFDTGAGEPAGSRRRFRCRGTSW